MSSNSRNGSYLEYADTAFDADAPVSTLLTHVATNNIIHLHDVASQHRINWVSAGNQNEVSVNAPSSGRWYLLRRWSFPWSFAIDGWLRQPVIYAEGYGEGTSLTFRFKVSPYLEARARSDNGIAIFGADADTFLTLDRSTTASSFTSIMDYPVTDSGTWRANQSDMAFRMEINGLRSFVADNSPGGSHKVGVHVPTLALEVYAKYDAGAEVQLANLTRVFVREFVG